LKKIILSLAIALSGYCAYAQNTFPTHSGNVGIGTIGTPTSPLSVTSSNLGSNPGLTASFNSNLGNSSMIGNQINISNSSNWGLLLGFDGLGVPANYYHSPNTGYIVNVQNAPLPFVSCK
jgi:hypothetical protein